MIRFSVLRGARASTGEGAVVVTTLLLALISVMRPTMARAQPTAARTFRPAISVRHVRCRSLRALISKAMETEARPARRPWRAFRRFAVACLLFVAHQGDAQANDQKEILLFHYYGADMPLKSIFDPASRVRLRNESTAPVTLYEEVLETYRFTGQAQETNVVNYLRRKYSGRRIDVVVAVLDPALVFLVRHRDELFAGVPIVAAVVKKADPPGRFPARQWSPARDAHERPGGRFPGAAADAPASVRRRGGVGEHRQHRSAAARAVQALRGTSLADLFERSAAAGCHRPRQGRYSGFGGDVRPSVERERLRGDGSVAGAVSNSARISGAGVRRDVAGARPGHHWWISHGLRARGVRDRPVDAAGRQRAGIGRMSPGWMPPVCRCSTGASSIDGA